MNPKPTHKQKTKARKLANALTITRALLVIPILISLSTGNQFIGFLILVLASLSDLADGWLARFSGGGSSWGAQMDPLADKVLIAGIFLWFAKESVLPIWGVYLLIMREVFISCWRSDLPSGGPASNLGKLKTILQFSTIYLILWPSFLGNEELHQLFIQTALIFFWLSLFFAYFSAIHYLKRE
ncbi:CDP-alcohol phosphatidyltransferase family protein [Prochlorococcus sp. MIT 1341]|uniref:CDP-alcohol phosphatidyltransferase family protein n=1 Tax=Prochlorococcus sp. MIT 1341 TaxID=3096221 RepID=UPI002A75589E|nr:CDP-alcohol phosphatidyltransferase family protein [Prochlorococcus sp. MIT 1341]